MIRTPDMDFGNVAGRPMRIAVVAHALRVAGGLSVGKNLVAAMSTVAPKNRYFFLLPADVGYEDLELEKNLNEVYYYRATGGAIGRLLFDRVRARRMLRKFEPDFVLCLANQGLGLKSIPQAILCHDPHLFYPEAHFSSETLRRKVGKRFLKWRLRCHLGHTCLLLCQTRVAQKRLVDTFGFTGRTEVVPNAISRVVVDGPAAPQVPARLASLSGKFVLFCLTRYYAHKNLESIVHTFDQFREELKNVVVVLTIARDQDPRAAELLDSIEHAGLSQKIINVGPLKQQDLACYFQASDAMILPTLLESFSGTYLEAMQFGRPVLTSDLDFARDVCGDAALYFNPWDPLSIKNAIVRLKNDARLHDDLAFRGKARVRSMYRSWDSIAASLMDHLAECTSSATRQHSRESTS